MAASQPRNSVNDQSPGAGGSADASNKPAVKRSPVKRTRPLVHRLVGLETEYATLVADRQNLDAEDLPASHFVYAQICEAIRRDQPTVSGLFDSEQMFLASGGAVTFESHPSMHALPGGLVEIATPEVPSPDELLACQRSIDELASDATADSETSFDLRILKNSSDALGHVYGCHENYEAEVASGFGLLIYRIFMALLWAMQVISLLVSLPVMGMMIGIVGLMRFFRLGRRTRRTGRDDFREHESFDDPSGASTGDGQDDRDPAKFDQTDFDQAEFDQTEFDPAGGDPNDLLSGVPSWLSVVLITTLRMIHLPTVMVLRFVARHVAFRRQRKYLTAMLASRVAICGSGTLDVEGRFQLSAKAMAIDSVADMGGFRGERPVFVFGHWLNQFCAKSFLSLASTGSMFHRRQRLQIGLSDSNMSELAEYVKVASVSLLLDMIESGQTDGLPTLKRPVASIKRIAGDWNLVSRVPTSRGQMSAIEIQKAYLVAAEAFVESTPANMRGEAPLVLYRWRELLDSVVAFRKDAADVEMAIGRVDWMTKHWLIEQLGKDADWPDQKKIDLRYHELSDDGYFVKLMRTRPDLRLVDGERVERRRRSPPPSSPAAKRGWLIREFADSDESMQSEWSYAVIGRGRKKRRVEFSEPRSV